MHKISGITCTYGRFTCIERTIKMVADQDYEGPVEHIIYNTDEEFPLVLDETLLGGNVRVINNNIDLVTHLPYTNVGAVRRDSLLFASGDYYVCVDDDDLYFPWDFRQRIDGILRFPEAKAWKPMYSLFETPNKLELARNTLEASIIVDIPTLRELGFKLENGSEHLSWYTALSYNNKLVEDAYSIPGYSYRWADTAFVAGHKQSGNMGDISNFENHKTQSKDHATRPLTLKTNPELLAPYFQYFKDVINGTHRPDVAPTYPPNFFLDLIEKYVRKYIS